MECVEEVGTENYKYVFVTGQFCKKIRHKILSCRILLLNPFHSDACEMGSKS